ncbi:MAG TPA: hypothetical protein H9671_12200 [Firmicutes bacterium]|nr:hypothetical protein [Bacillota bacterium]
MRYQRSRAILFISAMMSLIILCSSCMGIPLTLSKPASAKSHAYERPGTDFSEMEYVRPDMDKIYSVLEEAEETVATYQTSGRPLQLYGQLNELMGNFYSMQNLAIIRNNLDMTDSFYAEEVLFLSEQGAELANRISRLDEAILQAPYGEEVRQAWGETFVNYLEREARLSSPDTAELLYREQELVLEYQRLVTEATVMVNGEPILVSELGYMVELSEEEYGQALQDYFEQYNPILGEIFLQLVDIRTQLAETLGFDDYTDYAYEYWGRTYTQEDVYQLREAVKTYLVPLYASLQDLELYDSEALYALSISQEETFAILNRILPEISESLNESFQYMQKYHLYDLDYSPNKKYGGYTTYISNYDAPFLFDTWTGSGYSVINLIHEFGHYNYFYWELYSPITVDPGTDIAEVHSQALELLFQNYFEDFFGTAAADMKAAHMENLLFAMISASMEDEFQETVYENPDMTLDQINRLYYKLSEEYACLPSDAAGDVLYNWIDIAHTFEVPFYYISYALSLDTALQIWEISLDDWEEGFQRYMDFCAYNTDNGYFATLEDNGLRSPFEAEGIRHLSETLWEYFGLEKSVSAA